MAQDNQSDHLGQDSKGSDGHIPGHKSGCPPLGDGVGYGHGVTYRMLIAVRVDENVGRRTCRRKHGNGGFKNLSEKESAPRLIIADKFPLVRTGVRYELERSGTASVVGEAGDGKQAIEIARELKPEIAILGIGLPVLNGLEATARITGALPQCRVIILTRFEKEEYVWSALRKGATGYVLKRANTNELNEAIARVRQGGTFLSRGLAKSLFQKFCNGSLPQTDTALDRLTDRQCQILQLIAEGHNTKQIGDLLDLSPKTVDFHRAKLMDSLGLRTVSDLVRFAFREKLIEAE